MPLTCLKEDRDGVLNFFCVSIAWNALTAQLYIYVIQLLSYFKNIKKKNSIIVNLDKPVS